MAPLALLAAAMLKAEELVCWVGLQRMEEQRPAAEVASTSAPDDWELDPADIVFEEKIASGAFGDLYKGTYCGQEVAIKILRNVHTDSQQYQEFLQVGIAALLCQFQSLPCILPDQLSCCPCLISTCIIPPAGSVRSAAIPIGAGKKHQQLESGGSLAGASCWDLS